MSPSGVAFDGTSVWVANYASATVSKLRATDGALLGTFPVGASPGFVAVDGANVWVTNGGSGTVSKR
jgi:DNA-binding beta-propeller fold protein YncE